MLAMPATALENPLEKHSRWKQSGEISGDIDIAVDLSPNVCNSAARQQKCFAEIFLYNNPKWHSLDGYQRSRPAGIRRAYKARISVVAGATECEPREFPCDLWLGRAHVIAEVSPCESSYIGYCAVAQPICDVEWRVWREAINEKKGGFLKQVVKSSGRVR
jgi:hypothetical protein